MQFRRGVSKTNFHSCITSDGRWQISINFQKKPWNCYLLHTWKPIRKSYISRYFFRQSGRSRGCAPSPQNRLKRINKKIYTISFRFLQALETRRNNIKKKLNKNYKKIEKLSKTEQKLQKNIHTIYLFLLKTTLIKKNVTLQLYTHTRLLVKKRLLYLNSFELAFFPSLYLIYLLNNIISTPWMP